MELDLRKRLDHALVDRGLVASRARARDLVLRGLAKVNGVTASKPGQMVADQDAIAVPDEAAARVSRGGEKLAAAIDAFALTADGRIALDVGASTGGFTQELLARGAARVYAIDVGHGQLHSTLAADPRVVAMEGIDVRSLTRARIPDAITAIVVDVSFVSLTLILPAVLPLAARGAWLVALVKPQFEVGRVAIGKGGIVKDEMARLQAVERVRTVIAPWPGWAVIGTIDSPIAGGSGNRETLIGARHAG